MVFVRSAIFALLMAASFTVASTNIANATSCGDDCSDKCKNNPLPWLCERTCEGERAKACVTGREESFSPSAPDLAPFIQDLRCASGRTEVSVVNRFGAPLNVRIDEEGRGTRYTGLLQDSSRTTLKEVCLSGSVQVYLEASDQCGRTPIGRSRPIRIYTPETVTLYPNRIEYDLSDDLEYASRAGGFAAAALLSAYGVDPAVLSLVNIGPGFNTFTSCSSLINLASDAEEVPSVDEIVDAGGVECLTNVAALLTPVQKSRLRQLSCGADFLDKFDRTSLAPRNPPRSRSTPAHLRCAARCRSSFNPLACRASCEAETTRNDPPPPLPAPGTGDGSSMEYLLGTWSIRADGAFAPGYGYGLYTGEVTFLSGGRMESQGSYSITEFVPEFTSVMAGTTVPLPLFVSMTSTGFYNIEATGNNILVFKETTTKSLADMHGLGTSLRDSFDTPWEVNVMDRDTFIRSGITYRRKR